jgi:uncharacterized protein YndB with AHSA1/START domain
MSTTTAKAKRPHLRIERTYDAPVQDLWELWTTKAGFESWWGPQGFRVEVHALDPRAGGALHYDMIASGAAEIEEMKRQGAPISHETRGTFVLVEPPHRLEIEHMIDFIPGLDPYPHRMRVELSEEGSQTRMLIQVEPHQTDELTRMATEGMESQLTKLPSVLAARAAARSR